MKNILPLFIFVDACGWEIIRNDPFVCDFAPNRKRLNSVFGYSSACVPSILSGRWPDEHRNWCYFVYDPAHSPFKSLRWLRWLPEKITSRRTFRRWLSRFVKVQLSFRGYFDLYNIPFRHIALYDFTEKKSPLQPGGMNRGPNIFDFFERRNIPYHVSAPQKNEQQNLRALISDIKAEKIDFAFLYWPALDALMHSIGNQSPLIAAKLRAYEKWIRELLAVTEEHYIDVRLYVFSDHGMATCNQLLDLKSVIEPLPLRFGRDYAVVYDSTMARFWFFNKRARDEITAALEGVSEGRILPTSELKALRAYFSDGYFGELVFLADESVLIVPSHMGERPIQGMHGYHPQAKHSYAMLCTNQPDIPEDVTGITDIFRLMTRDAELAFARNSVSLRDSYERSARQRHSAIL